jgi:tetratricopeptide (TPR) repeat protein
VSRPFHLWKKALQIKPDDKEMRDNIIRGHLKIGENLMKQRLFGPALVHLKSVLQMAPKNAKVYIEIGNTYMMKGDPYSAIQNWEKASEIDPRNRDLKVTIRKAKADLGRA